MTSPRLPRRLFVLGAAALGLEGCRCDDDSEPRTAGAKPARDDGSSPHEKAVVSSVDKYFRERGLTFAEGALLAFARDALRREPDLGETLTSKKSRDENSAEKARSQLRTALLLSSDFFQNGQDEKRPVQYLRWYDPYETPCMNPMAHSGH